jgi:hypothetical protein
LEKVGKDTTFGRIFCDRTANARAEPKSKNKQAGVQKQFPRNNKIGIAISPSSLLLSRDLATLRVKIAMH